MRSSIGAIVLGFLASVALATAALADEKADLQKIVAQAIEPMMAQNGIPGMAVGIVANGRTAVYNFGVMSKETKAPVTDKTLFEVGSISKTFTATLTAYAAQEGALSLSDSASKFLPALKGSALDKVSLLNLGTHTTGGMSLQAPDEVNNNEQLMAWLREWKPGHEPGTWRTYANPSIGLLGVIAAKSLKAEFPALMAKQLYPALGLKNTWLAVPKAEQVNYAQGYTKADKPVRMSPGVLADEAYGVRTTASDMLRVVEANLGTLKLDQKWQRAVTATHTGYFKLGAMTQDLIWEQYAWPAELKDLLQGNSAQVSYEGNPVEKIDPPLPPQENVLLNKTGSTNGFGGYIAFIPSKKLGIVMLANRNYPNEARATAAYEILTKLAK